MANLLFAASAACLLLFLHPYLTYIVTLRALGALPIAPDRDGTPASATLVFAAFNEQRSLPPKIANLRAIKAVCPDIEIIAYSDGSSDGTVGLLEQASDILRVIASAERNGKAAGMRRMLHEARGDIVIFTDANVILEPAAIAPLLGYFADAGVGGVAGSLRYVNPEAGATARVGGFYWRLEEAIKQAESRVGSIMGADGSIFAMRRSLYPEVPLDLLDDMIASLAVTFAGFRLIHSTRVVAYEKSATSADDEFRRRRRIACRAFHSHRYVWPRLTSAYGAIDRYKYVSHKLLRWLGLVPLVLALAFLSAGLVISAHPRLVAAMVAGLLGCLAAGRANLPWFRAGYGALAAITATFLGVVDALRGRKMQTWTPAASRD